MNFDLKVQNPTESIFNQLKSYHSFLTRSQKVSNFNPQSQLLSEFGGLNYKTILSQLMVQNDEKIDI